MNGSNPPSQRALLICATLLIFTLATVGVVFAASSPFITPLNDVDVVSSTVPTNGDVNPYGVARVPVSTGNLVQGHILISNFNNSANLQGTGTTIVDIATNGAFHLFAQINAAKLPGPCPGGVGLTTALVVLRTGWVIVGSLPTTDGTSATASAGCLLVLNSHGHVVETFSGSPINGPWDMTALDAGKLVELFFTNVLNGTVAGNGSVVNQGTVVRFLLSASKSQMPHLLLSTIVGSGFPTRTDPAALVIGPTGLALDSSAQHLYVADSLSNRIAAISNPAFRLTSAGIGKTISQNGALNDPLGLTLAPNGNLIAANGNNGKLVEVTPGGAQVAKKLVDNTGGPPPGAGTLFGLIALSGHVYFVDDGSNTLNVLEQ
ncbi:MAG TPA: hypothetical protein VKT29_05905 [Terriglobales bacterium]|nr:hypothetical protein [Terriglobales bacterium]